MTAHVAVVGGGIGGLAATIALEGAGAKVSLYEQAPHLTEIGAGLSLWPNAIQALEQLGVRARAHAVLAPIDEVGTRTAR